jgi:predicted acyl esterase
VTARHGESTASACKSGWLQRPLGNTNTSSSAKHSHQLSHAFSFFRLVSAADSVHKIARDYTGKYYHLPPVTVYERSVFRRITIPMRDGTKLAATLATPGGPETPRPTILVRTPYGSTGKDPVATLYLERGLNYIVQDTRGRFESGGDFFPIKDERSDGGDTVAWIKVQPWSDGRVGVHGVSYMGMTALAVAGSEDPAVKVTIPVMASSQIYPIAFPAERAVALELLAVWTWLIHEMQNASALVMCFIAEAIFGIKGFAYRRVKRMLDGEAKALPLRDVDLRVVGKRVNYIADGLDNPDVELPFWETRNMLADLASGTIRSDIHFVGGWYDFFLHRQLQDFAVTQEAGLESRLTVGPWAHWDMLKYFGPSTRIQVAEYLRSAPHPVAPRTMFDTREARDTNTQYATRPCYRIPHPTTYFIIRPCALDHSPCALRPTPSTQRPKP